MHVLHNSITVIIVTTKEKKVPQAEIILNYLCFVLRLNMTINLYLKIYFNTVKVYIRFYNEIKHTNR